jgi:hypothetical protein
VFVHPLIVCKTLLFGAAIGAALGSSGCATAPLQPAIPTVGRSGDVELRLDHLRIGPRRQLVLQSRSTVPHVVRGGWLTVPTRAPCRDGARLTSVTIDGLPTETLEPGSHEIVARFDDDLDGYGLDVVLDLQLADGGCVRSPVLSQSVPLVAGGRFVIAGAMNGEALAGTTSGVRGLFAARLGGGAWLGDALLTAQAGIGAASCTASTCGRRDNGDLKEGLALPLEVDGRYAVGSALDGRGLMGAWRIGARYAFVPVTLPGLAGDRRLIVQTFQGVIAFAFGDPVTAPVVRRQRLMPFEVAFPVGIGLVSGIPEGGVGFAAGVDLRFVFSL